MNETPFIVLCAISIAVGSLSLIIAIPLLVIRIWKRRNHSRR